MSAARRIAIVLELDWPYARHINVFAGTQRYAQECGTWECEVDEFAHETLSRSSPRNRPYDGIIARVSAPLAEQVLRCRIPTVNVWYNSPTSSLPKVVVDFAQAGRLAAEHLLGLGLRRFACLSPSGDQADAVEISAFHAAVRGAGCECHCARISPQYNMHPNGFQRFHSVMERWMSHWQPPLGVYVTVAGITARNVVTKCRKRGYRVPDDVALIAGLNEPSLCLHPSPSLTSISVPYEEIGYQAARLLDQLMDGARLPSGPMLIPPAGISARQSTNCLAVDDAIVATALRYLSDHSHREISIDDVAGCVHTSRRTLERRFATVLGRSIAAEIRRLRVERAKRHLTDTAVPIKSVASMSGFSSEKRLYEAFCRLEGTSPAEFRAACGMRRWNGSKP